MQNNNSKFKINFYFLAVIFSFTLLIFSLASGATAATLFLAPSLGSYSAGNTFSASVKVNTDGKAINTAEATLTFDPTKLSVAGISKTSSVFSLWVSEPTFSNTDGTISFAGGKPSPGFTGSSGTLLTITLKGLTAGTANVNFSSASVLADDGLGTNILSSLISGAYSITTKIISTIPPTTPATPAPVMGVTGAPVINSSTHPEESQWYSNNNPEFSWQLPSGATGVSLLLHQKATANPGSQSDGLLESKKFENVADGVWYFHIKFRNQYGWGKTTHRKVLIDTKLPEPFEVVVDNEGDSTNPAPIFNFKTTDSLSGVEYYELKFKSEGGTITAATTTPQNIKDNPYQSLPLAPGKYKVIVTAYDKAKNSALAFTDFEILSIGTIKITKIPISIKIGESLKVEGEAKPELTVRIYLQKAGEEPVLEKVKPDSTGKFILIYEKTLTKDDYLVWAQAEDERGALSYPTKKYSLEVGLPPILKFGKIALDYLIIMITLIVLIVGVVAVGFYAWYRISIWRKRVKQETKEVSESVTGAFRALREEVEEQIEFLDGKPGLNKDERKVRDKLKEALNISEKFVSKEIEDVEKELE